MADVSPNIAQAKEMRQIAATEIEKVFRDVKLPISETQFAHQLSGHFKNNPDLFESGWYNPPPGGISALFAQDTNPERLLYDSLRKEQFWPREDRKSTRLNSSHI